MIRAATLVEANVREHIARAMYYLSVHLLFASMAASAAWALTVRLVVPSAYVARWRADWPLP